MMVWWYPVLAVLNQGRRHAGRNPLVTNISAALTSVGGSVQRDWRRLRLGNQRFAEVILVVGIAGEHADRRAVAFRTRR